MIKIYSHPRSGTHFLEAFVAENFYPKEDLALQNVIWGHWSNRLMEDENPYGKLFGGHRVPSREIRLNPKPLLYVFRDGRAVAYSIWKTPNFLRNDMKDMSFSDFLRTPIDWIGSPGSKAMPKYNIVQHWSMHVMAWKKLKGNVLMISYEDLKKNPDLIFNLILRRFFPHKYLKMLLTNQKHDVIKIEKPVGLKPNKAEIDAWKEIFTKEDLNFYYKNTSSWLRNLYK